MWSLTSLASLDPCWCRCCEREMIGTEDLKSESECWFLHATCHWAQMPHSTERGGDLTTLGARGWTNRTLEEVHDVVDAGLGVEHDEGETPGSRRAGEDAVQTLLGQRNATLHC